MAPGLTPVTLLQQALAVLEGLLPQPLLGRQQVSGGGGGREHGQGGAFQLRLVVWKRERGLRTKKDLRRVRGGLPSLTAKACALSRLLPPQLDTVV